MKPRIILRIICDGVTSCAAHKSSNTAILRELAQEIEAVRVNAPEGAIELPVKLKFFKSLFVPLAKWAMLLTGNYRCITATGMRPAQEAVHSSLDESRSLYEFVNDLCMELGAASADLVSFEKYAPAAESLTRPASASRALQNGAVNIERADKLVRLIAQQMGILLMSFTQATGPTLLSHLQNLTGSVRKNRKLLPATNNRLNTANVLKESFAQLWGYNGEAWARKFSIIGARN